MQKEEELKQLQLENAEKDKVLALQARQIELLQQNQRLNSEVMKNALVKACKGKLDSQQNVQIIKNQITNNVNNVQVINQREQKKKKKLTVDAVMKMNVSELKAKCKEFGLKQTGNKKALQDRLKETAHCKTPKKRKEQKAVKIAKAIIASKQKNSGVANVPNLKLKADGKVDKRCKAYKNGFKLTADGKVDKRCRAYKTGDIKLKVDGNLDKRCKAYKQMVKKSQVRRKKLGGVSSLTV